MSCRFCFNERSIKLRTRIFRSPGTHYSGDDILDAPDVYTDGYFEDLLVNGMNAIWLRARLRDAARTDVFPELGRDAERIQDCLNRLCAKAGKHGVRVFLYLNEPLCFPADDPFWQRHPDIKGVRGSSVMDNWSETYAICTSHPDSIAFLQQAACNLFEACPKLGGVFLINRSEHHTHCYSHTDDTKCPRCSRRPIAEVIAEVINTIYRGVRSASADAEVVAWNWSWPVKNELGILEAIEPEVAVMADFERGGWKKINGISRYIDEYSLSYAGPSEQFVRVFETARNLGHETFAKLQVGTTHEIATVINLPLIGNLLKKVRWLKEHDAAGVLACWNFGNRFSLNTFAFKAFLDAADLSDSDAVLAGVANEFFGVDTGAAIAGVWNEFAAAFDHYPFRMRFLYFGPVNYALAYPLPKPGDVETPMKMTWIPGQKPFGTRLTDVLDTWREDEHPFSLEEIRDSFRTLSQKFSPATERYAALLERARNSARAERELKNARVITAILQSTWNIFDAYIISNAEPFDTTAWQAAAQREIANIESVIGLLHDEKEIGYHIEAADWFFAEADLAEKLESLRASPH